MSQRIARLFEPLLRLLLPGRGRHRRVALPSGHQPLVPCPEAPTTRQAGALPPR
ncbi:hypothetical protein [Streptomyces sp. JNUCC 63]